MSTTPEPICPDCDATEDIIECTIGGRPGGTLREVIHAAGCSTLRRIV